MILPGHDPLWHEVFGCGLLDDGSGMKQHALVCHIAAGMQPASVDVRLGEMLTNPETGERRTARYMFPNEFMLGETRERVRIPREFAGKIEGKSSWGRTGLLVHISAGWIDPGFEGVITLEMKNLSNNTIDLSARPYIAQLALHQMLYPVEHMYNGRYQNAGAAEVAKL